MLREQIEKKKGKIISERLLSEEEETEISSTPVEIEGLEVTDIRIFKATQRPRGALFGRSSGILTSEGGEDKSSYSGSGIGKIQDGKVSRRGPVYSYTKEHMRRWH